MATIKSKSPAYFAFSIIAGIVCSAATFFLLIFLFIATGLFGWSDGGEKKYLERLETTTNITLVISILGALCVGIFVIYKMNKAKSSDNLSSPTDTP